MEGGEGLVLTQQGDRTDLETSGGGVFLPSLRSGWGEEGEQEERMKGELGLVCK